jgi:hypothetical protein
MAIDTKNPFESVVTDLDVVGVQPGTFDQALEIASQEQIAKSIKPSIDTEVPEIKIDVPEMAQISVKRSPLELQTVDLLAKKDPDAKSATDMLAAQSNVNLPEMPIFANELAEYRKTATSTDISKISSPGKAAEEVEDKTIEPDMPNFGVEPDLDALYDAGLQKAKEYGKEGINYIRELYQDTFGPDYAGQAMQTVPSALGQGYNLARYGTEFQTGLGTTTAQSSVGLSGAPPASLGAYSTAAIPQLGSGLRAAGTFAGTGYGALQPTYGGLSSSVATGASQLATSGPGVNALGQPMYGSTAAKSSGASLFGQAASIYGIYDGIKNKDYFSAGTALITLLNPATAIPMAIMNAAKMLFGAWSASNRPKPKFGGAEFKAEKNRLTATGGYGYNGYQPSAGQATVASISDYVNTYVKTFGLQFNGTRWAKAIEADPRLNRYDTMNDSGYNDPSVLSRKIFETDGLITGTPTYNGQPITSQEDYKAKMEEFNEYYKKTALERGGLVDAKAVGINTPLSNEYDKITFKVSNQVGGGGTGRQYTTRTTGGGRGGGGTTQTGYWQTTGGGGRGTPNRVWVPAKSNVVVQSGGRGTGSSDAYAISYRYEDATPFDMLYKNLVGNFNRGQGGTYY